MEHLIKLLDSKGIKWEQATLRISEDIQHARDNAWTTEITDRQIVEIHYSEWKNASPMVYGKNQDGLTVELGHIASPLKAQYTHGALGNLTIKKLDNGKYCVAYNQLIVLYDADELPPEAFLPPINLKKRAQKPDDTSMVVGCAILGLLAFLLLLWIKAC